MSRMTYISEEEELVAFAKKAAERFADNPQYSTFTTGDIEPGAFLAIRWGLGDDCVLVVKIAEDFQPVNFQQAIPRRERDL